MAIRFKVRCTPTEDVGVKIYPIMMDDTGTVFYIAGSSFVGYPTNRLTKWFADIFLAPFEERVAREVKKWHAYCEALQRTGFTIKSLEKQNIKWSSVPL